MPTKDDRGRGPITPKGAWTPWGYTGYDEPPVEQKSITKMTTVEKTAFDKQVGGTHYKGTTIQPIDYIVANELTFCEGSAVKYITRWTNKGGVEDLRKAIHYIELQIEDFEKSGKRR